MDYSKEYILEDDFVKLSPLRLNHVENLLKISEESSIWTYLIDKGNGYENLTKYILSTINKRKFNKEYPFIIYDKINNEYVGTTRFYEYSKELKTIKLGHSWYGEKFRGTGLNKHCKYLLFEFAFEKLNLERIGFGVHVENKTSLNAMKSVGCTEEGKLRNFIPALNGLGRADIILFSLLKHEWFDNNKFMLKNKLNKLLGNN